MRYPCETGSFYSLCLFFIGSDIKGNTIVPESVISNSYEDQSSYFFDKYSKDLLIEVRTTIRTFLITVFFLSFCFCILFWVFVCFKPKSHVSQIGLKLTV